MRLSWASSSWLQVPFECKFCAPISVTNGFKQRVIKVDTFTVKSRSSAAFAFSAEDAGCLGKFRFGAFSVTTFRGGGFREGQFRERKGKHFQRLRS